MEEAYTANEAGRKNAAAGIATIFFIFAYSPCYNLGYNALTYSKYQAPVEPMSAVHQRLTSF
jgi:hypothetical protein